MEKNSIADLLRYISFTGCSILKATSIRTYNTNKSKVLVPSMDPEDIVAPKKGAPNWVLAIGSKTANHTPRAIFFF